MPVEQRACPICASTRRRTLPVVHEWEGTEWWLVRCRECAHRYTTVIPTDEEMFRMYDDRYFADGGEWVCGYWKGGYVDNEHNLRQEAREVLPDLGRTAGRLLEVGCAGGIFLDEARSAGFEVQGIELNESMARWGREHLGLQIDAVPFERAELEGDFDVIIAQDVLEHVQLPHVFIARARELLAPGGALVIRGPLEASAANATMRALRRLPGRGPQKIGTPPFHLHGFTPRSFRELMRRNGLVLEAFHSLPAWPNISLRSVKHIVASLIGCGGHVIDRLRGGGDFMVSRATHAA